MHLKKLFSTAAAAVFMSAICFAGNAKYALCVGINKYSDSYGADALKGCANDAQVFRANLVELGGWSGDNATLLVDSAATKDAIRAAIAAVADKAVAGDTFVYQHSSHGGWWDDMDVYLCAHDDDYWDYELAEDLEAFPSGVKVVVVVDACHSGGLFKGARRKGAKATAKKRSFDLAQRVTSIMDASRARRLARGEKGAAKKLASSAIGWVTAAEYYETSIDFGFYDTDEWLTDPDAGGTIRGGTFLGSFIWSWWNGSADTAKDGDKDGWFDAYEGLSAVKAFCMKLDDFWKEDDYSFTPQFLNKDVLCSVELGESRVLPPPANDNFADATELSGASGSAEGSNILATREDDEPEHNDGDEAGSVWWSWTAPNDGTAVFDTYGSDFDTTMAIYANSTLADLELITANDDEDSDAEVFTSRCVFEAVAGTTYHVAVAGYYGKIGSIDLNWKLIGPDDVPSAPKWISASTGLSDGILVQWGASFAATSYSVFRADAEDGEKSKLGSTDETEWFDDTALPKKEYWYWVTASNGNGDSDFAGPEIGCKIVPPANDNFADATELSGESGSAEGSNLYATREEDEPWHYSGGTQESTVWWCWTAPCNGQATFNTDGSSFDTVMAVYMGDSLDWLEKIASNDDGGSGGCSSCSFFAAEGAVYYIAVAGYDSHMGDIVLNWTEKAAPPLAAPSPGETIALPAATTGVEYLDGDGDMVYLGFSGGAPFLDDYWGDYYFGYEIEGALPESIGIGGISGDDASNIFLAGTPSDDDAGNYSFTVRITDATGASVEQAFTLSIALNENQAPVIDSWSPEHYTVCLNPGDTQTFSVEASDPEGDPLSYSWSWEVYDEDNEVWFYEPFSCIASEFTWTPEDEDIGTHYLHVHCSDGERTTSCSWMIKVVPESQEPASNDNFADAIELTGASGSVDGSNLNATREEGEPFHNDGDESGSVWWRWTASADCDVTFDTDGSVFDTIMAVYTGDSLDSLEMVVSNDDGGFGGCSSCSFPAAEGTVYYIAVAGYGSDMGNIVLNWSEKVVMPLAAPSPGEAIELPVATTGMDYRDGDGNMVYLGFSGGTPFVDDWGDFYFDYEKEGSFPESLWIEGRWDDDTSNICIAGIPTDDEAGDYAFTIRITDATGTSVEQAFTLSIELNENREPVIDSWSPEADTVRIEPGETQTFSIDEAHDPEGEYLSITWTVCNGHGNVVPGYVSIAGSSFGFTSEDEGQYYVYATVSDGTRSSTRSWDVRVKTVPPNDNFANATLLEGESGSVNGSNSGASREDGEPKHGDNGDYDYRESGSVWWHWTAPRDGLATFDTDGSDFDTVMAVYTGDSLDSLNKVASDDDGGENSCSRCSFRIVEGTTYSIAVAGYSAKEGTITLTWEVGDVQPLVVESKEIKFMILNEPGSFYRECDLEASGGIAPYTWRLADGATLPGGDGGVSKYGELWLDYLKTFDAGIHTFDVVVTDSEGTETTETITLTIALDPNHRPVINGMTPDVGDGGTVTIRAGETLKVTADYSDPDGDALDVEWSLYKRVYDDEDDDWYYSRIGSLEPEEDGTVLFSRPEGEEGLYKIRLFVEDYDELSTIRYLYVNVVEADALVIDGILPIATEGEEYSTTLTATGGTAPYAWTLADDPHGYYSNGAAGLTADGEFTVDIDSFELGLDPGQIAYREFLIKVEDSDGHSAEQVVSLAIEASPTANARPIIDGATPSSDRTLVLRVGDSQTFSVIAHDPEDEPLAYSWNWETYDKGSGMWGSEPIACNASAFTWTPERDEIGMHYLSVSCSDGDKVDGIWWTIKVVSANVIDVGETIPDAAFGQPYEATLTQSGGTEPYSCALFGYDVSAEETSFAAVGEAQGWCEDDDCWMLDLPFSFPFDGGLYSQAEIDSNGRIFLWDGNNYANGGIYATYSGIYDDLRTDRDGCDIFVDSSDESVTVRWAAVTYDGNVPVDFSVTLCPDGGILMKYGNGGAEEFGSRLVLGDDSEVLPPEDAIGTDDILFAPKTEFAPGLTLSADGTISGTPTESGTFAIPVFVFDAEGAVWSGTVTLEVTESLPPPATTYTIAFSANDGTGTMDDMTATNGVATTLAANAFTRNGYDFAGWALTANGKVAYEDGATVEADLAAADETATLYAAWTPITYTATFDANGGNGGKAVTLAYGAPLTASVPTVTRDGYTFAGWQPEVPATMPVGGGTYVAQWSKNEDSTPTAGQQTGIVSTYTVKFNKNGGALPKGKKMEAQKFTYGKAAKLRKNVFTKKGYKFYGWATSANNAKKGIVAYKDGQKVKNLRKDGKTTTLYAVWAKPTYKVAFYGTVKGVKGKMTAQKLTYGKSAKLKANKFTRKGYKFAGWATSAAKAKKGKATYKNKQAVQNLVTNGATVKLYAVWKKK